VIKVNQKILLSVLLLTAALLAVPYIGAAHAKTSTGVNGAIMITGYELLEMMPKGNSNNVIMKVMLTAQFTGDISGTAIYEAIWIIHNDAQGAVIGANMHEKVIFKTATVLGKSGSLILEANMGSHRPSDSVWHWTILGGTEELANVHGHGTWAPETPGDMIEFYKGTVHFDP
jgi:hypothetical protein